jgi:excisionase family DNA binding protein
VTDKSDPVSTDSLPERLLVVKEAADFLRLSERTVWRMIDDGRLPAVRFGRAVRIRPEALAALMR